MFNLNIIFSFQTKKARKRYFNKKDFLQHLLTEIENTLKENKNLEDF